MKKRYEVNKKLLEEEIPHSLKVAEKTGKHTDRLGYMLIALAEIVLKKNPVFLDDWEVENIKQDMIVEMLETINRKGIAVNDIYNYLCRAAFLRMYNGVAAVRKKITEENKMRLIALAYTNYGEEL